MRTIFVKMSGLEALSLVCSIMQVISFTKEVLTVCKDVYEGRPTADRQMEQDAASIKVLLDEMNRSAGSVQQQTKEERELHAIAQKCSKAAEELQVEIQRVIKNQKPGSSMRAIAAGFKSLLGNRKITSLYDQFCKHQRTLETHLLVRLW
jgi:multidrug efflux pump subunit AcrB